MSLNLQELHAERAALDAKIARAERAAEIEEEIRAIQEAAAAQVAQLRELQMSLLGEFAPIESLSSVAPCASLSAPMVESSSQVVAPQPEPPKKKKVSWTPWAESKGFETHSIFFVRYKGNEVMLTGLWENEKYYLCGPPDVIPPRPEDSSDEMAEKNGWGVQIKWDCPTHAASLVKMALGAKINKRGRGADASPGDVFFLSSTGARVSVYE